MLLNIALGILALIVAFMIVAMMRPSSFRIERSTTISAPPLIPFGLVNDFHEWAKWSPWDKIDPSLKRIYEGPPSGVGAVYRWEGNKKVGEGRMTITDSRSPERIGIKLEFIKPWTATNQTEFTFTPVTGGTAVVWAMTGRHNPTAKIFTMLMNMDKMVGGDFEKGLAELKRLSEKGAQ